MAKKTTVVNIYHKVPYDVYAGRPGKGQKGEFGNPFDKWDRITNIEKFKEYFFDRLKRDREFAFKVHQLKGKILGCFCHPNPCHADVIADYVNNLPETKPMIYGIIGSRSFRDYEFMKKALRWFEISKIISGGAPGADRLAEKYAKEKNIPFKEFPALWNLHGKSAGIKRNYQIVGASDEIIAFWDGTSKGTSHSIQVARDSGKSVHTFWPPAPDDIGDIGFF